MSARRLAKSCMKDLRVSIPASFRMVSATVISPGVVRATGGPISAPNKLARR